MSSPMSSRTHFELNRMASGRTVLVQTSVIDSGVGIPQEDLHRLFQPWSQIHSGQHQAGKGTGLGLALSKQIIEKGHKGRIGVTSSPQGGSTFYFKIAYPLSSEHDTSNFVGAPDSCPVPPPTAPESPREYLHHQTEIEEGPFDVLVVDDSAMARTLLIRLLRGFGVSCLACENGEQAVELLSIRSCRLVLLDQEMPVMDGVSTARRLRQQHFFGNIVGLTGNTLADQISEFIANGADEVQLKPITRDRIESLLRKYQILRPLTTSIE
eukprot:c11287_g1_i1.p1 GENE.c11287_g1_i1~~c11287_g1_i1.p1  ORF type:complete len:299 (-),score=76.83 c11287_g1_i1:68-871(-)